jgi:hypothetical protein
MWYYVINNIMTFTNLSSDFCRTFTHAFIHHICRFIFSCRFIFCNDLFFLPDLKKEVLIRKPVRPNTNANRLIGLVGTRDENDHVRYRNTRTASATTLSCPRVRVHKWFRSQWLPTGQSLNTTVRSVFVTRKTNAKYKARKPIDDCVGDHKIHSPGLPVTPE